MGCLVGLVGRAEIDRSYAMNEVSNPKPKLKEVDLGELPVFGGSTSPFIEEGDGFTSERERARMFLTLVAHTDGDGTMVGARNTVDFTAECQVHVTG
jgi:hypothetical protein